MKTSNVRVSARIRPLPASGSSHGQKPSFGASTLGSQKIIVETGKTKGVGFHEVFEGKCSNRDIFDSLGNRIVSGIMDGFNATVFMYGQTGSGKTHTMIGTKDDPGLVQLVSNSIFDRIEKDSESKNFLVRCTYVEIYNENVYDLLNKRAKLGIKLEKNDSFVAEGNKEIFVKTFDDLNRVLKLGARTKTMGVSNVNEHSSRSHTIFSIIVESQDNAAVEPLAEEEENAKLKEGGKDDPAALEEQKIFRVATLNLVDLAGSESFTTKFGHTQQQETKSINKSLSALKSVVIALSKSEKHVPYRNSCLTKLLKRSLGGNAETDIIITLHAGAEYLKESKYTIDFGSLAKKVVCAVKENVASNSDKVLIRKYKAELEKISEKLRKAEALAKEKQKADEELRELAQMQRNMIGSPRGGVGEDSMGRILKLENLLEEEKMGRMQALNSASSRDAFVAQTILKNEMEMEKRLADMRLIMEQEREQLIVQQTRENSMVRSELREVMLQRREIDQLKNSLQEEREQKRLLQQALENAENTIMDLTLQMSSVNSQLFFQKSGNAQQTSDATSGKSTA